MGVYNQALAEIAFVALACLVGALLMRGRVSWGWIGGAIALYAAHKFTVFFGFAGLPQDIIPGRYNWEGKILGVALTLAVGFAVFRGQAAEWGFTLRQSGPAPRAGFGMAAFTFIATAAFFYLYWPGVKSEPTADWLYQLTMPSLDEEFLVRGVFLLMLDRAFSGRVSVLGAPIGWGGLITIAIFYVSHAMRVDADWSVAFIWGEILPVIYAALWLHVRAATGSLLLPVLLHSWANTAGYLL
jgi:hypothetical protein